MTINSPLYPVTLFNCILLWLDAYNELRCLRKNIKVAHKLSSKFQDQNSMFILFPQQPPAKISTDIALA